MSCRTPLGERVTRWLARTLVLTGLVVVGSLSAEAEGDPTPLMMPDRPPTASLIQVSAPSPTGVVTVTGSPGSVPGGSKVGLVTMETGHFVPAQAASDGSFSGSIFAPWGTSILVKADPTGRVIDQLISTIELQQHGPGFDILSPVPATILRVADPPATGGAGIPTAGAGLTRYDTALPAARLPAFTFEGSLASQAVEPGGTLRVLGTVRIVSPALQGAGPMRANISFGLDRLSGPDGVGSHARNTFASTVLTPTGFPIERRARMVNDGLNAFSAVDMTRPVPDRAEASVDISLTVPASFLPGHYRPYLDVSFTNVPVEVPALSTVIVTDIAARTGGNGHAVASVRLPVVRVGHPSPPRLHWTLLTDTLSNGTRGTQAIEERDRFGLASRIQTQSETFVVPRIDPLTGRALRYRLEPYLPTVCLGSSTIPAAPLLPLRFPSGHLSVTIRKPDGAVEVLGPAPFAQLRLKSLADGSGPPLRGGLLDGGGGHITDACERSTIAPRVAVAFGQDGRHVVTMEGSVEDIWGTIWSGGGTYEVHVARTLSVDTGAPPGMPFEVGDAFTPAMTLSPPVPAEVEVRFRLARGSDASRMVQRVVRGRANRFGYFQPLGSAIPLDEVGEYRVDVTASYRDEQGTLWMGARTWGGVIAPRNPSILAHGRRGTDGAAEMGPQWFFRSQTGIPLGDHVPCLRPDVRCAWGSSGPGRACGLTCGVPGAPEVAVPAA